MVKIPFAYALILLLGGCGNGSDIESIGPVLVVPYSEGGSSSQAARVIQQPLSQALGQTVEVRHIVGNGGRAGATAVFNSKNEQLALVTAVKLADTWIRDGTWPYSVRDMAIYSIWADYPMISVPAESLIRGPDMLLETMKTGMTLAIGTPGSAGDIAYRALKKLHPDLRIDPVVVEGGGIKVAIAGAAGKADAVLQTVSEQIGLIRSGDLIPIALISNESIEMDGIQVPSFSDSLGIGIANFESTFGLMVPLSSKELIERLDEAWPDLRIDMEGRGVVERLISGDDALEPIEAEIAADLWLEHDQEN